MNNDVVEPSSSLSPSLVDIGDGVGVDAVSSFLSSSSSSSSCTAVSSSLSSSSSMIDVLVSVDSSLNCSFDLFGLFHMASFDCCPCFLSSVVSSSSSSSTRGSNGGVVVKSVSMLPDLSGVVLTCILPTSSSSSSTTTTEGSETTTETETMKMVNVGIETEEIGKWKETMKGIGRCLWGMKTAVNQLQSQAGTSGMKWKRVEELISKRRNMMTQAIEDHGKGRRSQRDGESGDDDGGGEAEEEMLEFVVSGVVSPAMEQEIPAEKKTIMKAMECAMASTLYSVAIDLPTSVKQVEAVLSAGKMMCEQIERINRVVKDQFERMRMKVKNVGGMISKAMEITMELKSLLECQFNWFSKCESFLFLISHFSFILTQII